MTQHGDHRLPQTLVTRLRHLMVDLPQVGGGQLQAPEAGTAVLSPRSSVVLTPPITPVVPFS